MLKSPLWLLAGALCAWPASAQNVEWPTHAAVTQSIGEFANGANAEKVWIGKSRYGLEIEGLRFGTADEGKPAILVVGNVTGDRLAGTTIALGLAERLAGGDEAVTRLLDAATVYIIPEANPEAAKRRFETPYLHTVATGEGRDTDRDGRVGEDPPAEINGDERILWMRVPDPEGTLIADPHDGRLNVTADASRGERGAWKLMREGLDLDLDGEVAEDRALDAEVNKNFPAGFEAHTASGGLYGGSEPTVRALMDFVLLHPELVLVVNLDAQDNLVSQPDVTKGGRERIPDGKLMAGDAKLLAELGRRFQKHVEDAPKAEGMVAGSWQRWLYEHRGILTLDSAIWAIPTKAPKADKTEASGDDAATEAPALDDVTAGEPEAPEAEQPWRKKSDEHGQLEWVDATGEAWRFVDWQWVDHDQLGRVQVGGWAPYAKVEPPAEALPELVAGHVDFILSLGELMPAVEIASFEAEHLGKQLYRLTARVENPGYLPLFSEAASRARTTTRARVELNLPAGSAVIVGRESAFIGNLDGLGNTGRDGELEWLVTTPDIDAVHLTVTTRSAGSTEAPVTPKEVR